MARLPRLPDTDISEDAKPLFEFAQNMMGFTPNDAHDMARNPGILKGVAAMCGAIYAPGEIDDGLKRLIGYIASTAAGCKYCQMHTAHGAHENGIEDEKIRRAWEFETSPLFSDAERAALTIAANGAMSPSEVTDTEFETLRQYFSDNQIVEIVAVISMFGFLNRWNAIMDTDIEVMPRAFATEVELTLK